MESIAKIIGNIVGAAILVVFLLGLVVASAFVGYWFGVATGGLAAGWLGLEPEVISNIFAWVFVANILLLYSFTIIHAAKSA